MSEPIGGLIRQNETEIDLLRRVVDGVIVTCSFILAAIIYDINWSDKYTIAAVFGVVFFYISAKFTNVYAASRYRRMEQEASPVFVAWIITIGCLLLLSYAFKVTAEYSRVTLGLWFLITPISLILFRWMLRIGLKAMRVRGYNSRSVIIVGTGTNARRLEENIKALPWTGLSFKGYITEKSKVSGDQVIGNLDDLYEMVSSKKVEVVYIALPMNRYKLVKEILEKLAASTTSVFLVPDFEVYGFMQGHWVTIGDVPTVTVIDTPMVGISSFVKRIEDLVVAIPGIIITLPLMVVISVLIKLDSRGPVFYVQNRNGFNGEVIPVLKFRSMTVTEGDDEFKQAIQGDKRVSRIGHILRITSLDELPQLYNVLLGQMSVVGPRPHALAHNEQFRDSILGYMLRHKIKPGITGLAQINGFRGETDTKEKMAERCRYDMMYLNNWSLWLDIKIILITPFALIKGGNAY